MVTLKDIAEGPDEIVEVGAPIPRIWAVEGHTDFKLNVTWVADGAAGLTELLDFNAVRNHAGFRGLFSDPETFAKCALGDGEGHFVAWPDGSEMDAHWLEQLPRLPASDELNGYVPVRSVAAFTRWRNIQ